MSEFKVGDKVCLKETVGKCLFEVVEEKAEFTDKYIAIAIISPKGNLVGSSADWIIKKYVRHATPEEIAAGHRIDNDMGDDHPIENHISPLCKSKDV
ncbi:hypothetical protein ACX0AN_000011 [Acinetobacter baumannii]|uniref:hypothetical protein n=1 Tax=Acinetobacter baumannii TaxID=470 RepID=UPI0012466C1F|nr:hypothetical protein [Acinetobacter baumannii]EKT8314241.1 hypothetical protein [Acinetobacter baumannii]EKT9344608.1 hypothetical protein [Acinetobacter baumannii]EKT9978631.1 hypothetical protein [Acinetobacter baumannii]EKU0000054.1 hypothetical protein [Acinetobacter baumannii]EKU0003981.1 hypothetical protein [Acinetobacter baumannii]